MGKPSRGPVGHRFCGKVCWMDYCRPHGVLFRCCGVNSAWVWHVFFSNTSCSRFAFKYCSLFAFFFLNTSCDLSCILMSTFQFASDPSKLKWLKELFFPPEEEKMCETRCERRHRQFNSSITTVGFYEWFMFWSFISFGQSLPHFSRMVGRISCAFLWAQRQKKWFGGATSNPLILS